MDPRHSDRKSFQPFIGSLYDYGIARGIDPSARLQFELPGASVLDGHSIDPGDAAALMPLLAPPDVLRASCRRSSLVLADREAPDFVALGGAARSTRSLAREVFRILDDTPGLRYGLGFLENDGDVFVVLVDLARRIVVRQRLTVLYVDALLFPEWPRVIRGIRSALDLADSDDACVAGAFAVVDGSDRGIERRA